MGHADERQKEESTCGGGVVADGEEAKQIDEVDRSRTKNAFFSIYASWLRFASLEI